MLSGLEARPLRFEGKAYSFQVIHCLGVSQPYFPGLNLLNLVPGG